MITFDKSKQLNILKLNIMGYTHYWDSKKVTEKEWNKFLAICKKLKDNLPEHSLSAGGYSKDDQLLIGGNEPNEKAEFNKDVVWFNGQPAKLGHETFHISSSENDGDFNFCKTARKPYDLLVGACLIAAKKHLKYSVRSDGDKNDWQPIFDYYNKTTGELINNFIE